MNNPNPVLSIRVITVFLLSGQQSILKKPYSARLSTTISHHSNLLPHLVMDGFEAHDSAMDSFNIDDLKSLVSLLVIGTSQTISRTDLLLELDRFRDLRIVEHRTDVASSTSSPNFTFKQPSKVVLPVEIEPCMEKSTAKKPSAKNEGKENNCFTQESLQFNPPRINFTVGNGGQVKRHGRPRRGATPHKSPPGGDVDNMPDFTSFFLFSKENVEPHSDNVTRNLKEDCFYPEFSVANTNISSTSPEFSFRLASDFTSAIEKPLFSTPSSHPKYSSPTADRLPQTTFSETFRTNCSIRDEAAISVGTHSRAEILTPQSADSAMSVDSANMEHDEVEDALDRSILDSQSRERHNGFHPQSLKFDFTPSAVKGKMDTRSEGALFSIGQHSIAHKKGEKRTSPGQRKRFDTTANASVLIDYLASVSISDTSQIDKGDAKAIAEQVIGDVMSNGSRTDPLSGQNGLIFTSGLDFKFASSNATMKESSTRAEDTASTCFDPTLCFRNPSNSFSFHSSVIKIARPPSPKKSPSATVYPAHIRRTKTPTKIVRGSPKKPQRSPSTSPMSATKSMDVDASPVPTITLRSKEIPVSARKKKQEKSPCVAPVRTENGNYGGEWDTGSDSTDDSGSDSNPRIHVAEKEACAPMSVLKPSSTSGWRGLVPDESAERMNELANQYRKQGGDLYSRENYEQALDSFEKSLKFGSPSWANRSTVLGNRAATLMMLSRYVEAAEDCATAILADPNMAKLHSRRGRALMRLGRFTEANEAFSLVLEASSSHFYDLEAAKIDAKNGLKVLISARSSMKRLSQLESVGDLRGALNLLEELTAQCPSCAVVHTSKCNVLCKLLRWTEAKECAEEFICAAHKTIQMITAHPNAMLPAPTTHQLTWSEKISTGTKVSSVTVNIASIVQAALIMGPDLAKAYLTSLKNIESCPNCCSDLMLHVQVLLSELYQKVVMTNSICDPLWGWVERELKCSKDSAHWKDLGDRQFRTACLAEAVLSYTNAINADPQSIKWSAVLFNNRAAAHMGLGRLAETIADCHQAISRDPNYSRAYLRRARALGVMKSYAASIRDFRHFLSSTPTPLDASQVTVELENMVETNRREIRGDHARHAWETRGEEPRRPCGAGVEGGAAKASKTWGMPSSKARYSTAAGGGPPKGPSSSKGKSNLGWDSDEEAFFIKAKQQHFQKCNKSSSNPKTVFGPKPTSWGSSRGAAPSGGDSNAEEGEVPNSRSADARRGGNENQSTSSSGVVRNGGEGCHYHTLGIDSASTERQIKVAYRKLALKYHPDKNKEEGAEDNFKTITSAYSVIIDKTTREQYDRTRRGNHRAYW